jgi:hypothetical protein
MPVQRMSTTTHLSMQCSCVTSSLRALSYSHGDGRITTTTTTTIPILANKSDLMKYLGRTVHFKGLCYSSPQQLSVCGIFIAYHSLAHVYFT